MRILVAGAGVIGTVIGGRLAEAGNTVTMLARGDRLAEIAAHGLLLEDTATGRRSEIRVGAIEKPERDDRYDLVVVAVRDRQLPPLLPILDSLAGTPEILLMLNCPMRVAGLVGRFGADRVVFGFPGAGGVFDGSTVRYTAVRQQPTTFGPVNGQRRSIPRKVARLFAAAGFATSVVSDMDGWLKTHAFLVAAICGALYRNGGKSSRLAEDGEGLALLRRGILEGFRCLAGLGLKPSPVTLRLLVRLAPEALLLYRLKAFFSSKLAEFAIDGHATAAPDDMRDLAGDCRTMIATAGVRAPAMERLCAYVEAYAAQADSTRAPAQQTLEQPNA